jgi:hypothetical protein
MVIDTERMKAMELKERTILKAVLRWLVGIDRGGLALTEWFD